MHSLISLFAFTLTFVTIKGEGGDQEGEIKRVEATRAAILTVTDVINSKLILRHYFVM